MIKRLLDFVASLLPAPLVTKSILVPVMVAVWLQDFHCSLSSTSLPGEGGELFHIVKLRSMIVGADKTGGPP